jgi:Immunity protein 27
MSIDSREHELNGAEAIKFANDHLRKVKVNAGTWEVDYVDDLTGETWVMDYPNSEPQGGGSPRLRRR